VDVALKGFSRFPTWMWKNHVMRKFIIWLRHHNSHMKPEHRCGIFGLDLYSLHLSMQAVVKYFDEKDPMTAVNVEDFYSCFDRYGDDPQTYGLATSQQRNNVELGSYKDVFGEVGCCKAVIDAHTRVTEAAKKIVVIDNDIANADELFMAQMNAEVVVSAEEYYRGMYASKVSTWEIRDNHFFHCLERVQAHLLATRGANRVVVWAHNSHIGDASHVFMADPTAAPPRTVSSRRRGRVNHEVNIGQLCKEKYKDRCLLIGQTTYHGQVLAAHQWNDAHHVMTVKDGLEGSVEELMHQVSHQSGKSQFLLNLRDPDVIKQLHTERIGATSQAVPIYMLERAIGVIYHPHTELQSHYFHVDLTRQFDMVVHFDKTHAVTPLDKEEPAALEIETYPSGL